MIRGAITVFAAALLFSPPQGLLAQSSPTPAAPTQPASDSSKQTLSAGQLDALVAPIALYPDALLSEILMASTYPLEVVEASRWADANKSLKGDALKAAVDKQPWDNSVKSLVATRSALDMMSQKLTWTQQLGDALLAQQADVMDAIQRLRTKAQANNKLTSNKQQTVTTEQQDGKQIIVIAPAEPDTLFVPYYDPAVVYGPWPYPAYPPYYWPAPGYIAAGVIATGIAFGAGYALGRWTAGGYWGGGFNWGGNNININRNININNINRGIGNTWTHNPEHRLGVRYTNANVQQRFGQNNIRSGAQDRLDFRGHGGQQVLRPGGTQANIGGNRVGGGSRERPSEFSRPGGRTGSGGAFGNISSGSISRAEAMRGRESFGGGEFRGGGGEFRGGGGGFRGGGGGFHGGGRRSDIRLKHDIVLLGRLDDGLGFYRFIYNGGRTAYVGVMAQEVKAVMPEAVERGADGYLRVHYEKLGLKFETYADWIASGAKMPAVNPSMH